MKRNLTIKLGFMLVPLLLLAVICFVFFDKALENYFLLAKPVLLLCELVLFFQMFVLIGKGNRMWRVNVWLLLTGLGLIMLHALADVLIHVYA
jgi:hypothetical protein